MAQETFTTSQTWTVPAGVQSLDIEVYGGEGGASFGGTDNLSNSEEGADGGHPGYSAGTYSVNPGDELAIDVGQQGEDGETDTTFASGGFGGSGTPGSGGDGDNEYSGDSGSYAAAAAGGGGGASRVYDNTRSRMVIAAGGGGGAGIYAEDSNNVIDGNGGGGGGGTQGAADFGNGILGGDGAFNTNPDGQGPNNTTGDQSGDQTAAGGGGGGGAFAGGEHGEADSSDGEAGGGGGGDGYQYSGLTSTSSTTGDFGATGDGEVVITYVQKPAAPNNVTATYYDDDRIDVSFDGDTSAGSIDNYEVQMNRDGTGFTSPNGGPSAPSSDGTYTYNPASDTGYDGQVGVDSSFVFRVRATGPNGSSPWVETDTMHTTPVPPHKPSVSRPDANTVDLTVTRQSDAFDYYIVEFREDTGGGYGPWKLLDAVGSNGDGSAISGSIQSKGDQLTMRFETDATYQYGNSFGENSRVQFRVSANVITPELGTYALESEWVYADYGNGGNVFFEDDFESGDLTKWSTGGVYNGASDPDSGIQTGGFTDLGINGPDEGTYYCRLDAGDDIRVGLGGLSSDTDIIVKAAVATGSMDTNSEATSIQWYDGSQYQTLRSFSWAYNRQGWVEVSAVVPQSYLNSQNTLKFQGFGGGGDHFAVDRVVVSDILHEYTSPAAPTELSLDASTEGEITATWTSNQSVFPQSFQEVRTRETGSGAELGKDIAGSIGDPTVISHTDSGLPEGEQYDYRIDALVRQYRRGSIANYPRTTGTLKTATTVLPAPTDLASPTNDATTVDLTWTANHSRGETLVQFRRSSDTAWSTHTTVSRTVESETIGGLLNGEEYDVRVVATTDDATSEDI